MELNKKSFLRKALEEEQTAELESLLDNEIRAEESDENLIREILQVLEERDRQNPNRISIDGSEAWEKYKAGLRHSQEQAKRPVRRSWHVAVAMVALIVLLVLPQVASADGVFELMAKWSDSFFAFFSQADVEPEEYVFKTDNPGLQQVYDAVVEMGVADPVVPMWLENGYELVEIKESLSGSREKVHARFVKGDSSVILTISLYSEESSYIINKSEDTPMQYEYNGIIHYISRYDNLLTAVWARECVVCTLSVDCQEETLHKILQSIYTWRDNK